MEIPVRSTRLKSLVWNDFERVKKGDAMMAICKHCKKKLSASSTSGTSHLKNHLNRCKKKNNRDVGQQVVVVRGKQKDGMSGHGNLKFDQEHFRFDPDRLDFVFDQERSRYDLARMIIMHEYPLTMVEHVGFKKFLENLQPSFQVMSSDNVKSDCMQIFLKQKQIVYELLDKVPGRISLSVDLWNSYQDHGYLCLTAYYFNEDWLLQKKVLSFVTVVDSVAEEALGEAILSCIRDWPIDHKLFSMTFDSCCTNDIVARIRDRLAQNRFLLSNGRLFHVRCANYIISLLAQDVLQDGDVLVLIHKIRECVRYVKSSEATQQKFNEISQQFVPNARRNLCLDSPTLWNSTYLMLEAALEHKYAFAHLEACDPGYTSSMALSEIEWGTASSVCDFLRVFVDITNVFSSMKSPTANLYLPEFCDFHMQLIKWCKEEQFISNIAKMMRERFETYWSICGLVLAIAAILDPRFKMKLVEYYYQMIYGSGAAPNCIKEVANGIKELFNEYAMCSTLSSSDQGYACGDGNGLIGVLPSGNSSRDRLSGFDEFLHANSDNQQMKSELDKYLEEPVFPRNVDFNILSWWKVNAPKYPILSIMARDVLGIPISTVAPGLAFSTVGRVLDTYRSSLSSDILQALICTHDWLQNDLQGFEPAQSQSESQIQILSQCQPPSAIPLSIAAT